MTNLEELTAWQKSIGYDDYQPGYASQVALLGLAGETGEVLAETDRWPRELTTIFVATATLLDEQKKTMRRVAPRLACSIADGDAFDAELADVLYYLNAAAISRGLSLEELAGRAMKKVRSRNAEGQNELSH